MSLLSNKVKFDRVSVDFCQHIIYLLLVKLHDRSCETSFQTLIDGNLGNVSAGVLISIIAINANGGNWPPGRNKFVVRKTDSRFFSSV